MADQPPNVNNAGDSADGSNSGDNGQQQQAPTTPPMNFGQQQQAPITPPMNSGQLGQQPLQASPYGTILPVGFPYSPQQQLPGQYQDIDPRLLATHPQPPGISVHVEYRGAYNQPQQQPPQPQAQGLVPLFINPYNQLQQQQQQPNQPQAQWPAYPAPGYGAAQQFGQMQHPAPGYPPPQQNPLRRFAPGLGPPPQQAAQNYAPAYAPLQLYQVPPGMYVPSPAFVPQQQAPLPGPPSAPAAGPAVPAAIGRVATGRVVRGPRGPGPRLAWTSRMRYVVYLLYDRQNPDLTNAQRLAIFNRVFATELTAAGFTTGIPQGLLSSQAGMRIRAANSGGPPLHWRDITDINGTEPSPAERTQLRTMVNTAKQTLGYNNQTT